jgi:glycosyltransferase involved in cell wall biosynthesis
MTPVLRLSAALVTRHRPESLARCLASLRAQEAQPGEVVISDDSADPAAIAANTVIAQNFGARYIAGPRRGLYANRNAAALACTGTHLRTMDDDHTFPAGHFARCLEAIETDPGAVWTCSERSFIDGRALPFTEFATQLHPSGAACEVTDPDDNWAIADGATIYPREVFQAGLRLVEDYPYGSSYLEFGALLYQRGWHSRCIRGTFVEHHTDDATRTREAPESCLFASLCYNLYFRRNLLRAARHAAPLYAHFAALPRMLQIARKRWKP